MLKKFFTAKGVILLIIILASFFRLYKISIVPPSLFGDELDLGYHAYSIFKTGRDYQGNYMPLNFHSIAEWRTPLYIYSAVPTVALFGITPFGVRLPAAIFGILSIWVFYLLIKKLFANEKWSETAGLTGAALMAISPLSLQYSRAGFEVTEMLFFIIAGLLLFLKSLQNAKWLWLSLVCFLLSAWTYSTAKLFVPALIIILFLIYRKEILAMTRRNLVKAAIAGLIIGLPLVYGTFFAGGTQRIGDISILTDPNMEQEVGMSRRVDLEAGSNPLIVRLINNKYTYFTNKFLENYLSSFSTEFLFTKGDINLRQSSARGGFYLFEFIPLLAGVSYLMFSQNISKKIKTLLFSYLFLSPIPASLTMGGGTHATRLFLVSPSFLVIITLGWLYLFSTVSQNYRAGLKYFLIGIYLVSLLFYLHSYYFSYPTISAQWWHYGWEPAVSEIKKIDSAYDRVIISMSSEPAWIFFAGNYMYDPVAWQKEYPIGRDENLSGFGTISHTGKFYFGSPDSATQIYGLGRVIDSKTLYLANAKEHGDNLVKNPDKVPEGLKLIKTFKYQNGDPVMYLFSGI